MYLTFRFTNPLCLRRTFCIICRFRRHTFPAHTQPFLVDVAHTDQIPVSTVVWVLGELDDIGVEIQREQNHENNRKRRAQRKQ